MSTETENTAGNARQALLSELVAYVGGYNASPPAHAGRFRSWEQHYADDNEKIVRHLMEEYKRQVECPLNEKLKTIALQLVEAQAALRALGG